MTTGEAEPRWDYLILEEDMRRDNRGRVHCIINGVVRISDISVALEAAGIHGWMLTHVLPFTDAHPFNRFFLRKIREPLGTGEGSQFQT